MTNYSPKCPKCGSLSTGLCNFCLREERQVAANIEATLSTQKQMLQEQRKMAEDQRLFNQKILEQAISKEEAYENGRNYEFKDGDTQFSEDGFEFNINSPYVTDKLKNSFFEGVKHNFNNHFPDIDWSIISNQVAEAAIDFRGYLGEKLIQINENPPGYVSLAMPHMGINPATGIYWTQDEVKAYADNAPGPDGSMSINEQKRIFALDTSVDSIGYERRFYRIIKESNIDGEKYCLHLLCVKFKVGYKGPGYVFVEGIESAYIKNSSLWKVFNDVVDLVNLLAKVNQPEKIIQSNEILLSKDNYTKKNNSKIFIIIILVASAVSYLLYLGGDFSGVVKKLLIFKNSALALIGSWKL